MMVQTSWMLDFSDNLLVFFNALPWTSLVNFFSNWHNSIGKPLNDSYVISRILFSLVSNFTHTPNTLLTAYTDDHSSTSAYVIFHYGNPVSCSSKKQRSIARSSIEAKFWSIVSTVSEIWWLRSLLFELGVKIHKLVLYSDNLGATFVWTNHVYHSKMKHVEIDFYFIRDKIAKGLLNIVHIPSEKKLADTLTKALPHAPFVASRFKLDIHDGPPIFWGRNNTTLG